MLWLQNNDRTSSVSPHHPPSHFSTAAATAHGIATWVSLSVNLFAPTYPRLGVRCHEIALKRRTSSAISGLSPLPVHNRTPWQVHCSPRLSSHHLHQTTLLFQRHPSVTALSTRMLSKLVPLQSKPVLRSKPTSKRRTDASRMLQSWARLWSTKAIFQWGL